MARIRTIKPDFFTSESIARLDHFDRLLFIGLWTHVDDAGRCINNAALIRAALFPIDDPPLARIQEGLRTLSGLGMVQLYSVSGRNFLRITKWSDHQRISHPTESKLPGPEQAQEDSGADPEDVRSAPDSLPLERKGREQGREGNLAPAARTPRAPDLLFEAVCRACDIDPAGLTSSARGPLNSALKQLREVGATADEVEQRARHYRSHFDGAALTPMALAKHWALCERGPRSRGGTSIADNPTIQRLKALHSPNGHVLEAKEIV